MTRLRNVLYVGRFFLVVPVVSPLLAGGLAIAAFAGAVAIACGLASAGAALTPVLVLHLFAAASGFAVPARRGHYDLALTTGQPRWAIALLHCLVSMVPGCAAWAVLAAAEAATTGGRSSVALASGTGAAFFTLSAIAWAVNIRLPRLTGGVAWLVVMTTAAALFPRHALDLLAIAAGESRALPDLISALLCPFSLVGVSLSSARIDVLLCVAVLPIAAVAVGCGWIHRSPIPLEAAQ